MTRLIEHRFEAGQRWKNDAFILYIVGVNDDLKDENGTAIEPGKICVTDEKPFPERKLTATDLNPANMEEVIVKGGYLLMEEGWTLEFNQQKEAMLAARAAAGEASEFPAKPPALSGLGAMMIK